MGKNKKEQKSYILFNKPYGVLCQFTDTLGRPTIKNYITMPNVYAVGRLDIDTEGLLFLTNDGDMNNLLTNPKNKIYKTYWAQVEGIPTDEMLLKLEKGILIKGQKTLPAITKILPKTLKVWERSTPIRFRKTVPTSWIELKICEGKNHQVKKMTAAVGLPCLRLIRTAIGSLFLGSLLPGEHINISSFFINRNLV